ncbi:MAG: hypothetical protein ACXVML_10385, partial [Flavisolibacter sp.]
MVKNRRLIFARNLIAKEKILVDDKTLSERAYELDLRYPQPFTRVFKQHVDKRPKGLNGPSVNKSVADC